MLKADLVRVNSLDLWFKVIQDISFHKVFPKNPPDRSSINIKFVIGILMIQNKPSGSAFHYQLYSMPISIQLEKRRTY